MKTTHVPFGRQLSKCLFLALAIGLNLAAARNACAEGLNAQVVGIKDGDTFVALVDRQPITVRLSDIDAPERRQAFGDRSKQALANLVFRKPVRLESAGADRYGRTIARVYLGNLDINLEMVKTGYAWAFLRYTHDPAILSAENSARSAHLGLWSESAPIPPWRFRRDGRGQ